MELELKFPAPAFLYLVAKPQVRIDDAQGWRPFSWGIHLLEPSRQDQSLSVAVRYFGLLIGRATFTPTTDGWPDQLVYRAPWVIGAPGAIGSNNVRSKGAGWLAVLMLVLLLPTIAVVIWGVVAAGDLNADVPTADEPVAVADDDSGNAASPLDGLAFPPETAPTDAGPVEFCSATFASIVSDPPTTDDQRRHLAEGMVEIGTPSDMPPTARMGFEAYVNLLIQPGGFSLDDVESDALIQRFIQYSSDACFTG